MRTSIFVAADVKRRTSLSYLCLSVRLVTSAVTVLCASLLPVWAAVLEPADLRTEWLRDPLGIDATQPRLSWRLESSARGQRQSACRVRVANTREALTTDRDLVWDSSRIESDETSHVYAGRLLRSGELLFWSVKVWNQDGQESEWSAPASWSMGLLQPGDWQGQWISFRDTAPLHTNRNALFLPPARQYRREFQAAKPARRATVYASALGIFELHLNGQRVGDAWFEPGWSDYLKRAYYRTHDVTSLLHEGSNAIGAMVADGWYAGYVGYGLLVGYGPNKTGRYFYGRTPALLAQLEVEYADGSREIIATDSNWQVTSDGPLREADLIMGEAFDARRERRDWCTPGGAQDWEWRPAIPAGDNGSTRAVYSDTLGAREVELGFQRPPRLQAYSAPSIRVTEELKAQSITEPAPGVYIFDLGQNFAGVARLRLRGEAGRQVRLRYGEMLHPDGRLMTENLRRARATDFYTFRGDPDGEEWRPRFTYHGFRYVELTGLEGKPDANAVIGLVLHNDTPQTGSFECSDEVMTRFARNAWWTQRANFVEVPTDCPQRDERLGWMGDAQAYARTASYNADVAAFYTKWFDDVEEAQRSFGAYPDYCPYPMAHGSPYKSFGTAWTDAGILCPWTVWKVYGDTRVLERHWNSMTRFMEWRAATATPEGLGVSIGNTWGDWLNVNETTPIEYVDTCYHALVCQRMAEMAAALGRPLEAARYRDQFAFVTRAFQHAYVTNSLLRVDTQTAYVLALWVGLMPEQDVPKAAARLAAKIAEKGYRMSTGFLGTRALLPALSDAGRHDLAVRLFQNREFPSWGYEVVNGATTVWERWDSYTREHGFNGQSGNQNASMNSFSHYAFGAVMEWAYRNLAGIDTDGAGFKRILLRPEPPSPGSNPTQTPINWVKARYDSVSGRIESEWRLENGVFELKATIPPNTIATVYIPSSAPDELTESGRPLAAVPELRFLRAEGSHAVVQASSGAYQFRALLKR